MARSGVGAVTIFFDNPRLLATAVGLVLVAGLSALATIVRQEDPTITNGVAVIVAPFPGASAERVEALVTDKIEDELRELAEIETVSSVSRAGVSVVTIQLDEQIQGRQAEEAFSKARDALGDATARLPRGLPPPFFDDERFGAYSLIAGVTWEMPGEAARGILKRFGEELQDVLRDVPGTDAVRVFGAPTEEIVVTFDPQALAAAGLTTGQVAQAIAGADAKVSAGVLRGTNNNVLIEVTGELDSLERIRRIPLSRARGGALLVLGDIAEVRRTVQAPANDLAIVDGKPAVVVAAKLAVGERFDRWAERARAEVHAFAANLPDGLELRTVFDQAGYTQARLSGLGANLLAGFAIVVSVLFLTLGFRSALIASASLPLVSLAAIFVLRLLGVPIHQMSVTGLIVALGLLVDNAIVVTDSIRSKRLKGIDALSAVESSLQHLWSPLLSSTVTTILAFMPILLLKGRVGEFVGAIGLSVIVSLAISYLFAMTIVPAFAGRLLRGVDEASGRATFWRTGLTFPALTAWFERSLDWSLNHPRRSMLLVSTLPLLGLLGALTLPQQFFPPADRNQFHIEMRLPQQASIEETAETTALVDQVLKSHQGVLRVNWFVGRSAPPFYYNLTQDQDGKPSYAQAQVTVASVEEVGRLLPILQRELDDAVPHAQILVRELLQGPPVFAPLEFRIYGPNLDTLRALGMELRERMSRVPTVVHTLTTLTASSPKIWLRTDEEETNLAGLDLVGIANQLNFRLEGIPAGSILEDNEVIPVRVRVADATRSVLGQIGSTSLLAQSGMEPWGRASFPGIPLGSLMSVELRPSLDGVPHRNGRRVNVVRGYTTAGVFPDEAFRALNEVLAADPLELPLGYRIETGGDAAERQDAMGNLFAYVPVLVLLMVALVSLSLNSFRLGAVVFVVALQSMGLGLLSVAVFRFPLGFQALIGLVGLVGVAINAAIVINAALLVDRDAVMGSALAVRRVVVEETSRHIVSTTVTTFGGFLPLMLSAGGFWPPFATGIAGGVLLSTIVSFYFVPAAFLVLTRRHPVAVAEPSTPGAEGPVPEAA